jgi:hypothetical protein
MPKGIEWIFVDVVGHGFIIRLIRQWRSDSSFDSSVHACLASGSDSSSVYARLAEGSAIVVAKSTCRCSSYISITPFL